LADAMRVIDGLCFGCWVPPGIEDEDVVGGRQIQPHTACLRLMRKAPMDGSD
jgi:hypothetical protein